MFLIGLELDHKLIRGSGHSAVLISHVSIVLPFSLGVALSLLLYPLLGSGRFVGFALFIGASMAITAFPVLARILTDTGLHRTRIGALSITCAAVDDVTAWCILAVVVAVVKSSGAGDAIQTIVLTGAFVVFMLTVVRPLAAHLARVHEARGTLNPQVMAGIIIAVLLAAWATEEIGIHAIFGAFMAGAMMPRSPSLTRDITDRLEDVTVLLLLPVFFAVAGLSTRFGVLDQPELWWVVVLVIGAAIIGKWGGSMVAARAAGQPWRQSNGVGLLMNTRGLTEIVILTVGRGLGVISPALFTIMVLMALVTTFMATPLLAITYPRRLIDREIARAAAVERVGHGLGRGPRVLIGVGNPLRAGPLVELVASLRAPDGSLPQVTLAHVVPPPGREEVRASFSTLEAEAAEASEDLSPWRARLRQANIEPEIVTVVAADAGEELVRLAQQLEPDLVVIGSHEPYFGRNPLGGVAADLFAGAGTEVAVLLHRGASPAVANGDGAPVAVWFKGILNDVPALDLAAGLARGRGTRVRVVQPMPGAVPDLAVPVDAIVLEHPGLADAVAAVEGSSLLVVARASVADGALPRLRHDLMDAATVSVLVVQGRGSEHGASDAGLRRQSGAAAAGARH
jgi:Kef-type K+ transport system membrane component KefB/nucleotide-binding universal stress UspA family protein